MTNYDLECERRRIEARNDLARRHGLNPANNIIGRKRLARIAEIDSLMKG